MLIKYQIEGYSSFWIRECESVEELTRDLTDSRGAFKACEGKKPKFSYLEILHEEVSVFGVWYVEIAQPSRYTKGRYMLMAKNNNGIFMHKKVFLSIWDEYKKLDKTKTINMADWHRV
jgi:hypothetical protein